MDTDITQNVSGAVVIAKGDELVTQHLGSKRFVGRNVSALGDRIPEIDVHDASSCLLQRFAYNHLFCTAPLNSRQCDKTTRFPVN
jgi:hypothetical protein